MLNVSHNQSSTSEQSQISHADSKTLNIEAK